MYPPRILGLTYYLPTVSDNKQWEKWMKEKCVMRALGRYTVASDSFRSN